MLITYPTFLILNVAIHCGTHSKRKNNMNKIRIIGLVILVIGIIIQFALENDATDFISGLLIGAGIGLLLTGKIGKTAK